jgi:hypothetical protein
MLTSARLGGPARRDLSAQSACRDRYRPTLRAPSHRKRLVIAPRAQETKEKAEKDIETPKAVSSSDDMRNGTGTSGSATICRWRRWRRSDLLSPMRLSPPAQPPSAPVPGRDRPLTELDMLALQSRHKSKPHKMEWPLKRSWPAVAWCAGAPGDSVLAVDNSVQPALQRRARSLFSGATAAHRLPACTAHAGTSSPSQRRMWGGTWGA